MTNTFTFIIYGNSDMSLHLAKAIIKNKNCKLLAIVTLEKSYLPLNSLDIGIFTKKNNIECIKTKNINSVTTIEKIKHHQADIAIANWPKIIGEELLNTTNLYTIGTHPTNLPLNKGRHPLHWFISLDIFETTLSFFRMGIGIDDGDIIHKQKLKVKKGSDINKFNNQMSISAFEGMAQICEDLVLNKIKFYKQDKSKETFFRKRNFFDTLIDPRMSARSILNHINSFKVPYSSASLIIEKNIYQINEAKIVSDDLAISEYGKVFNIHSKFIDIKVEDKIIRLYATTTFKDIIHIKYIYPPTYYYNKYTDYYKRKFNES